MTDSRDNDAPWLVLVHQLPAEPSRVRVKNWRRLQGIGAVAIKNSVYVLPNTPETREDFEWIRAGITAQGGEAMVFAARAVDELSSAEVRDAVERVRHADWEEVRSKGDKLLAALPAALDEEARAELRRQVRALRARAAQVDRIDHLGAAGRRDALAAVERLERRIDPRREGGSAPRRKIEEYRARVWLTRPRPGIDRMASAWLIRRFIDPGARFRFADRIPQEEDVVPFDMFGVELGHQGDRVTFETLLHEFGLDDPALSRLGRIVHEIDLRSETRSDVEADTVDRLVDGLRASVADDDALLEHAMAMVEALYASFSAQASAEAGGDRDEESRQKPAR